MPRKPMPGFGVRGCVGKRGRMVRAVVETRKGRPARILVLWREPARKRESWPDTPENRDKARAFAEGVLDSLEARGTTAPEQPAALPPQPPTLRELRDRYAVAQDHWSGRTVELLHERWGKLELHKGRDFVAERLTREDLDDLRRVLREAGHVSNQIAHVIKVVRQVFAWAVDRDLVPPTKVATYHYKRARGEGTTRIPEYSADEARKLLGYFDPRAPRDWRAWVAFRVLAFAGKRAKQSIRLRWDDVDFAAGTITWRAELDKMRKARTTPMPPSIREALWVAYGWRLALGYAGPWVLFRPGLGTRSTGRGGKYTHDTAKAARAAGLEDRAWTYSAAHKRLIAAELATGVPHIEWRAFHSLRRFVVTQLTEATGGNLVLAGQYVGDDDIRTLQRSYLRERPEQLQGAADLIERALAGADEAATPRTRKTRKRNQTATPDGDPSGEEN